MHTNARRARTLFAAALLGAGLLIGASGCAGGGDADFTGIWGDPGDGGAPTLTIEQDGSFSGTDGCNRLSGKGEADGDTFAFGEVATTLMACEDVDTWLNLLDTGRIVDGELEISDAGGAVIGSLPRQ